MSSITQPSRSGTEALRSGGEGSRAGFVPFLIGRRASRERGSAGGAGSSAAWICMYGARERLQPATGLTRTGPRRRRMSSSIRRDSPFTPRDALPGSPDRGTLRDGSVLSPAIKTSKMMKTSGGAVQRCRQPYGGLAANLCTCKIVIIRFPECGPRAPPCRPLQEQQPVSGGFDALQSRAQREATGEAVTGCTPRGSGRRCTVPRRLLQLYRKMEIWVSARNALGTAESERLCIDPMDVAKLDPPTLQSIRSVPYQTDCISVAWEAARTSAHMELQCELRYRSPEDLAWALPASCSACWQRERDGGTTRALIQDGIEPFQQYNISVYPLYKDAVGVPVYTAAYSKQKAPSCAPKLHLKSISKSHAELCWEPIPVEMQNGFITNYTVFWANSTADVSSAVVNSSLSSFVIWDLKPSTLYKVHIMASTAAGSTNGTSLTLVTMVLGKAGVQPPTGSGDLSRGPGRCRAHGAAGRMGRRVVRGFALLGSCPSPAAEVQRGAPPLLPPDCKGRFLQRSPPACFPDDIEIQFLFLTLGLIFVLLILLMICFQKNGRVKKQFWPSVPDPANSSLGKWVPAELQQEPLQIPGVREPGLATISTVTVLERVAGKQPWGKDPMAETTSGFPDLSKSYVQQDGPGTPSSSRGTSEMSQRCYRNGGEAVQYAKVVGDGYKGQQHIPSRLYVRSSSTQPLLFDGTPSPKSYENLWFQGVAPERLYGQGSKEDKGFLEEPLINFPLLQGLKIGGAEELCDFQRL
nr:PREDICTED: granulocyte colony-stimulating factor receptor [Apteryx mantelli mantelli]